MKKKTFILFVFFLFSGIYAAPCDEENANASPGIPTQSCQVLMSDYHIGLQNDGLFFIDSETNVQFSNKNYRLRFFVTSTSLVYNQVQALAQTSYATKSSLHIIFPNFSKTTVGNADSTAINNSQCSVNSDGNGNPANMYCPIMAITIRE